MLDDAFPSGAFGSPGCQDRTSGDISRRQEKKKARRCRGPAAEYLNSGMNMVGAVDSDADADRPAVRPMAPVPALNKKTGLTQHMPVTQQYEFESFVGEMDDLPTIRKNVEGPSALQSQTAPAYFGASPNESPSSGLMTKANVTEHFSSSSAPFVDVIGQEESYKLSPDFGTTFGMKGVQKAGGSTMPSGPSPTSQEDAYLTPTKMMPNSILPFPNVDNFWKNNPTTGGQSAFYSSLKAPGGRPSGMVQELEHEHVDTTSLSRKELMTKLDKIYARLDDMDSVKSENAQTEVLLFIMTGLGVIFLMDIGCRTAAALARK